MIVVINSLISQLIKMINFIPVYELAVFLVDKSAKRCESVGVVKAASRSSFG